MNIFSRFGSSKDDAPEIEIEDTRKKPVVYDEEEAGVGELSVDVYETPKEIIIEKNGNEKVKDFYITKNADLKLGKKSLPIDKDGGIILNWYGPAGSFEYVPLYKVIKAAEGENIGNTKFNFKNKII